jgi:2-polyprenyl-3-methyl-5-hydroxy-6-metoxy-1,4-benzoquinol methylase
MNNQEKIFLDIDSQKIFPCAAPNVNDKIIKDIIREIEILNKNEVSFLDLGAGRGYNVFKLINYCNEHNINCKATAVDISKEYFQLKENNNLRFVLKNLNEDFYFEKFDFVIATEVIEHLENPYHFIRNCLKNLKEEGKLYISSPNIDNIYSLVKIFLKGIPSCFFLEEWEKEHIMPISSFLMKKILFKLSLETKKEFDLKITFNRNLLLIPIRKPGEKSDFHFTIPGANRFFGEIAIYKIRFKK